MSYSPAIIGANYNSARSFEVAYTTASTAEQAIAGGSYQVYATSDCYVKLGITGMGAAAALPSTQPAISAPNGTIFIPANQPQPLDVGNNVSFFRVIGKTASGTLGFNGPITISGNR